MGISGQEIIIIIIVILLLFGADKLPEMPAPWARGCARYARPQMR